MRAPFTQLYVHLVWSTWDRLPLIWPAIEACIFPAMLAKCQELKCEALAVGGVPDHVHILVRFTPTTTIAKLVQELKGSTSHLVTHEITPGDFFKWQGAYRAFTVARKDIQIIRKYIANQKEHHQANTFFAEWEP